MFQFLQFWSHICHWTYHSFNWWFFCLLIQSLIVVEYYSLIFFSTGIWSLHSNSRLFLIFLLSILLFRYLCILSNFVSVKNSTNIQSSGINFFFDFQFHLESIFTGIFGLIQRNFVGYSAILQRLYMIYFCLICSSNRIPIFVLWHLIYSNFSLCFSSLFSISLSDLHFSISKFWYFNELFVY